MDLDKIRVEKLAYQFWQERGSPSGSPDEDWFRAEGKLSQLDQRRELPLFAFAMGPTEQ